jgi:hypothetical protein
LPDPALITGCIVFQSFVLFLPLMTAAGAALWSGWRWLDREVQRVDEELRRARRGPYAPLRLDLKFDPSTGVYLPITE